MRQEALEKSKKAEALTKRELVTQISKETGITQLDVSEVVQRTLDGIVEALNAGRHVEFREFGVFELMKRKSRIGRNPNKPETAVVIPERTVVKFKPGKRMRQMLAEKA
ncbi:MAG: integration host factor subunit beta [Kiritimatiellae bacterium]|nr:integration host factor subunit beta [Kiritimatiellia bacterium]MDD4025192.1 integration host factor subunit beta [Kiritimatiellia bacterium]